MKYVVIGNGVAGICAAETIRGIDSEGSITLIADETYDPYCRPMISLLLEGAVTPEKLSIRSDAFYDTMRVEPVLGNRVDAIDVENQRVSVENGLFYHFDRLLIATGADPRPIKAEGMALSNIFYMRTRQHVEEMLGMVKRVKTALVLGGGLVGFKAAYGLLRRKIKVTMLIRSGYPLSMQVDETAGSMITEELRRHGLTVKTDAEVIGFEGRDAVEKAHLSDGTEIRADMVVIGKGVLPCVSFVPVDKIEVDLGIRVNGHMQTSVEGIYAAGDVAEYIDIARQTPWVNAIWPEAVTQGKVAGMNMAGRPFAYEGSLSRNVIRIFNTDVMTAGIVNPPQTDGYRVLSQLDDKNRTYRKLVFHKDRLVGMVMINRVEQGGVLTSLIRNCMSLAGSEKMLMDPKFNFRYLLQR